MDTAQDEGPTVMSKIGSATRYVYVYDRVERRTRYGSYTLCIEFSVHSFTRSTAPSGSKDFAGNHIISPIVLSLCDRPVLHS